MCEQVLGIWAPNLRPIACTRPGWEEIRVVPTLEVREVAAAGTAHHKVKVSKAVMTETMKDVMNPSGTALERKKVRALKSTGGSSYSSQVTSLQEFDVADKISDPAVHRYLHAVERTTNIDPAYRGDRTRLERMLAQYGTIAFGPGTAVPTSPARPGILAADLAVGDAYASRWSRVSAAHEFGHMIGLMDEYYAAGSVDTVKHMISDGLLPPDTPEDHFTQGQKDASSEAAGQAATTGMLQANDLPSPDYTQAAQAKSTSLMSGGSRSPRSTTSPSGRRSRR